MAKASEDQERFALAAAAALHGDILDSIVSHVRVVDLLSAHYVSKEWQRAVRHSLANPSRVKPWLIVRIQSSHNPSLVLTRAYDPESCTWIEIPPTKSKFPCLPIRSCHSKLVYTLTASKLCYSLDAFGAEWVEVDGPKIWRCDPVVVKVGCYLVVAGGTYDFEDDPLAVEVYDAESRRWEICQSIPDAFKCYAASTWLSIAVSDEKMFLLEKNSGTFSSFDSRTKTWGSVFDVRPTDSLLFFSLIGFSNGRLVLVGLIGDPEIVEGLKVWEVNCETFCSKKIGEMPSEMLEELIGLCFSSPFSINIWMEGDVIYICNPSHPKVICLCELSNGSCCWARVSNSATNDQNLMRRFVFTCSQIGINELKKAFQRSSTPPKTTEVGSVVLLKKG